MTPYELKEKTKELLSGCIIRSDSGVKLYTPDGKHKYKALWTRDFAFMIEYAGDLIPCEDIENGLEYLLAGADVNGWIPDRVEKDGTPRYTAGFDFPARPNLDNAPFLAIAARAYFDLIDRDQAKTLFSKWRNALCRGIDILPKNADGIIENIGDIPHSPFGFTDTVSKTGLLSFETLLLWRAMKSIVEYSALCGGECEQYLSQIRSIEAHFAEIFTDESGMLLSATQCCRQIDIWASCYAVAIGFPLPETQKRKISDWLAFHYEEITEHGQVRHLPKGESWEKTFVPVKKGTYQNGAFWATASGFLFEALLPYHKALAHRLVSELLTYFAEVGIYECVNGDYKQLETYVASATNVYGILRAHSISAKRQGQIRAIT